MAFSIRLACAGDISGMHGIRMAVAENRLSDPGRVTEQAYLRYVREETAWVAEQARRLVGFAVIDSGDGSIWALFVDPAWEGRGIGSALHDQMLGWAETNGLRRLTLTTSSGTRAESFYLARSWRVTGRTGNGEATLELALG